MHNVNYEINAIGKSRDLVDFFLFFMGAGKSGAGGGYLSLKNTHSSRELRPET